MTTTHGRQSDWVRSNALFLVEDRGEVVLRFEPGGRIDRRDVLMIVLLVLFTLTLRGFRLDQPVRMYFDEVYHARTATELMGELQQLLGQ